MRAGRVIAHNAADCRALGAGRVRTKHQVQRRQLRVQRAQNQSRLDINPARLGIDAPYPAHVPRKVHDDRLAHRLPSQRAAAPARQNRNAMLPRRLVHGDYVIGIARESHR